MAARVRMRSRDRGGVPFVLAAVVACVVALELFSSGLASPAAIQDSTAQVRLVHGVAAAGPLDVYVDGSLALIGIVFGETSGDLALPGGEHDFAVVPSGATIDAALAAGTINLRPGAELYAALLGTSDETSVGLFQVDSRPLDSGQARFRVISGAVDVGALVPAFAGGDPVSEPLKFGDASEYATLDAGTYDLELRDGASGAPLLSLPGIVFAEGTATDVIVVGQVSDGSLAALIETTPVQLRRPVGQTAQIVAGTCAEPGSPVADLGVVQPGQGEAVGVDTGAAVAQGFGVAAIPFATLTETPYALVVAEDSSAGGQPVACGAIGGRLTDTGALVIQLDDINAAMARGIAVLAPSVENPDTTGISVFLTGVADNRTVPGTPVAASG
jgi:hypothetical protein